MSADTLRTEFSWQNFADMPESPPDPYATSEPLPEPVSVRGGNEIPALVVVWSPHDPSRLGEVLLIDSREDLVFGRGDEPVANGRRVFLHRQRPGISERMPPLQASGVSRSALILPAAGGRPDHTPRRAAGDSRKRDGDRRVRND